MVGEHVAICSNEEFGEKYIDFVDVRRDNDDEWYEDDDSPVVGGIDVEFAEQIRDELSAAVEIMKAMA